MSVDYAEVARLIRKGRRSEQRAAAVEGCLTALATAVLSILLKGWLFMFAVGVIHAHWIRQCPPIGYGWSVLLMALLPSSPGSVPARDRQ